MDTTQAQNAEADVRPDPPTRTTASRRNRVRLLRDLVAHGLYRMDPDRVADGLVRRLSVRPLR